MRLPGLSGGMAGEKFMKAIAVRPVTPLMRMALKSFRTARKAIVQGRVHEMIVQLNRGMGCLAAINGAPAPRR